MGQLLKEKLLWGCSGLCGRGLWGVLLGDEVLSLSRGQLLKGRLLWGCPACVEEVWGVLLGGAVALRSSPWGNLEGEVALGVSLL